MNSAYRLPPSLINEALLRSTVTLSPRGRWQSAAAVVFRYIPSSPGGLGHVPDKILKLHKTRRNGGDMSDELVLRFGQKQPDGSYPVFISDEPVGVFQPPFSGDLTAEVAETEATVLEHWAGAAPGERTVLLGILERLARRLTAMGAVLSEALFAANPPLAEALADAPADASLVLQFESDERELLRLPWEYLTDPDGRRLAALRPLARRLGPPSPLRGEGPGVRGTSLRLLACIAEPLDQGPVDGQTVRERLMDATRPLREAGWLEPHFLPLPATPDRLASALGRTWYTWPATDCQAPWLWRGSAEGRSG
jgi:hypothetical protein